MLATKALFDLAKNVFQVHGVDQRGHACVRKKLRRAQVVVFFANLSPCWVGLEACSSAHYWARKLQSLGHTVRLIAPQFVKPYVETNKTDAPASSNACLAFSNMRRTDRRPMFGSYMVAPALTLPI